MKRPPNTPWWYVAMAAGVEAGVLGYMALPVDSGPRAVSFVCLQMALVVPALLTLWVRPKDALPMALVLGLAAVLRLSALPSNLIFENDVFRYLWDGRVASAGVNPYRYPPAAPELAFLVDDWVFPQIPYRQVPTIYPPLAQVVFLTSRAVFGESVYGFQLLLVLFDLGTVVGLRALGRSMGGSDRAAAAYALHPLAIQALVQAAHVDAVAICLSTWALVLLVRGRALSSGAAFASAALVKVYPLIFLPLAARRLGIKGVAVLLAVAGLPWALLQFQGVAPFRGLATFARYWIFNPSIYDLVVRALAMAAPLEVAHAWARPACGIAVVLVVAAVAVRANARADRALLVGLAWSLLALLALSPAANTWYVAWLLPLALVLRWGPGLAWTATVPLAFMYYRAGTDEPWWRLLEYGPVLLALAAELIVWRKRRATRLSA